MPKRLDRAVKRRTTIIGVCVRTLVFRGGPELGQLGGVRPIKLRLQMKCWAIRPWLDDRSGRGTPKNEDIMFCRVGARQGISDDHFDRIWINCSKTGKDDICGRIDDGCEEKICGEQNQECVDSPGYDRRQASGRKGEQQFPDDILVVLDLWMWSEQRGVTEGTKGLPRLELQGCSTSTRLSSQRMEEDARVSRRDEVREGWLLYKRNRDWGASIYTIGGVPKSSVLLSDNAPRQKRGE